MSILLAMPPPMMSSVTAAPNLFCTSSTIVAGSHTSEVPKTGKIDAIAATVPQKNGFGRPTTQKPIPIRLPWITAISVVPRSVASVTLTKRSRKASAVSCENGM